MDMAWGFEKAASINPYFAVKLFQTLILKINVCRLISIERLQKEKAGAMASFCLIRICIGLITSRSVLIVSNRQAPLSRHRCLSLTYLPTDRFASFPSNS